MDLFRIADSAFAAHLRLYPAGFRNEFGEEIREVFSESLRHARRRGLLPALAVGLREAADFPVNWIAAYWEEYSMQNLQLSQPVRRPLWWGAVGFGLSAALISTINSAMYLQQSGAGRYWFFWGELLGYLILGGLGSALFALICKRASNAKLYFIAGSLGFLIGHLLWFGIGIGAGILAFYSGAGDVSMVGMNIVTRWLDLALMISLTGLFIGWMNRNLPLALRLAGSGALGAAIGGVLGAAICGLLYLVGMSVAGRILMITSLLFLVNALAGIIGGALLGRAVVRGAAREIPDAA